MRIPQELLLRCTLVSQTYPELSRSSTHQDRVHTHHMKGIEFHKKYSPQSCPRNVTHMAATLGAGEQDSDIFQALAKYNAVAVGGTYDVCF
jgi:hypothetical protein